MADGRKVRFDPSQPVIDWDEVAIPKEKGPGGVETQPCLGHLLRQAFQLWRAPSIEMVGLCWGVGRRVRAAEKAGQVWIAKGAALEMIGLVLADVMKVWPPSMVGQLAEAFGFGTPEADPLGELEERTPATLE
jgi:hypothetical protein